MERLGHLLDLVSPLRTDLTGNLYSTHATPSPPIEAAPKRAGAKGDEEGMTDLERSIQAMEQQLEAFDKKQQQKTSKQDTEAKQMTDIAQAQPQVLKQRIYEDVNRRREQERVAALFNGWSVADGGWQPTPLGCLDGKVPDLALPAESA